jgi:hypothetical protein
MTRPPLDHQSAARHAWLDREAEYSRPRLTLASRVANTVDRVREFVADVRAFRRSGASWMTAIRLTWWG